MEDPPPGVKDVLCALELRSWELRAFYFGPPLLWTHCDCGQWRSSRDGLGHEYCLGVLLALGSSHLLQGIGSARGTLLCRIE